MFKIHLITVVLSIMLVTTSCNKEDAPMASHKDPAIIGAIRWDAFHTHSPNNNPLRPVDAMEKSLGPQKYQFRAPFFTKVINDSTIRIDGYTQEIVDAEIEYASEAGLDYWAFLLYDELGGANYGYAMSEGIHYYLSSTKKSKVNFCAMETPDLLFRITDYEIKRIVNYVKEPSYQRVHDNRPLIYFYGMTQAWLDAKGQAGCKQIMDDLRTAVKTAVNADPYIVLMATDTPTGGKFISALGADAITSYYVNTASAGKGGEPYPILTAAAKMRWFAQERAGLQVVPIVAAGWDRRPRVEHPVPWEHSQLPGVGIDLYYRFPSAGQLTDQVQQSVDWLQQRRDSTCPSGAVLIYAWNEHDEGGWLCPTVAVGGGVDKSRLQEIKNVRK